MTHSNRYGNCGFLIHLDYSIPRSLTFVDFGSIRGEYKLMGQAAYGEAKYVELILRELLDLKDDGWFRLNMRYFGDATGTRMANRAFDDLFGLPPRKPAAALDQFTMVLAESIQRVTEMIVLRLASSTKRETGARNLSLAGVVALYCVANGRLLREGPFDRIWIQPLPAL